LNGVADPALTVDRGRRTVIVERGSLPGGDVVAGGVRWLALVSAVGVFGLTLAGCVPPAGSDPVVDIAAGGGTTCAARRSGEALCWGWGSDGQLGNGTNAQMALTPTKVSGFGDAIAVAVGGVFACGLHLFGGTVSCWGRGSDGELGNGSTADSNVPVPVTGLTNAIAISAGSYHACALLGSGAIECWGRGGAGQLGDGNSTDSSTPVTVKSSAVWTHVSAGNNETCAIDNASEALCWGDNYDGQLGAGLDPSVSSVPGPLLKVTTGLAGPPLTPISSIGTGNTHACAVAANQGYCWGEQDDGELGTGVTYPAYSDVALPVSGFNKAGEISSGSYFSCATLALGGVDCWGRNGFGQLGNGTTTPSSIPVVVSGLTSIRKVSAGDTHACALRSDGSVSCWGDNFFGEVGNNSTTDQSTPVTVL
jgi:alpha-tubulin suppressor-like RCC1 family protein